MLDEKIPSAMHKNVQSFLDVNIVCSSFEMLTAHCGHINLN